MAGSLIIKPFAEKEAKDSATYYFTSDKVTHCIRPGYVYLCSPSDDVEVDGICGYWLDCPVCDKRCSLTVVISPPGYRMVMLSCRTCGISAADSATATECPETLVDSVLDAMERKISQQTTPKS